MKGKKVWKKRPMTNTGWKERYRDKGLRRRRGNIAASFCLIPCSF